MFMRTLIPTKESENRDLLSPCLVAKICSSESIYPHSHFASGSRDANAQSNEIYPQNQEHGNECLV
jgi:hypothetical protein